MQVVANEKTQRGLLVQGLDQKVHNMFLDMWLDDLNTSASSESEFLDYANAILKYFNSPLRALSVDWDNQNSCYIWLFERDNTLSK